jgi:2,3-bisphosphoglycerate-dependent phosphoglycerate mutase
MVLDGMTTQTIAGLEIATGIPLVYHLKADATVEAKTSLDKDID